MPEKYGANVQPMNTTIKFKNDLSEGEAYITYKYLTNQGGHNLEWERDPARSIQIQKPSNYQGQNQDTFDLAQRNSTNFIINGHIERVDANF